MSCGVEKRKVKGEIGGRNLENLERNLVGNLVGNLLRNLVVKLEGNQVGNLGEIGNSGFQIPAHCVTGQQIRQEALHFELSDRQRLPDTDIIFVKN